VIAMRQSPPQELSPRCMAGFTLIEILVSITIFAILATIVYSSLNAVLSRSEAIKESVAAFEMAKNTLSRMSRDLRATFVEQYPEYQVPGIVDPPDPYRFQGEEAFVGGKTASRLTFASTEHLRISSDIISGLGRIMYYAESNEDRNDDLLVIRRSDLPFPYDIDPNRLHDSRVDPVISEQVASFVLTYVDEDGQTHQEWDSDSDRFRYATPRAVIIEISIEGENGTHAFETRVDIPVYRNRIENVRR